MLVNGWNPFTLRYAKKDSAIDFLLREIDRVYKPDYILIDARAGIHDIGGLALLNYSDEVVMVFYGNQQNMQGLRFTLPKLIKKNIPFYLLNSPAPINEDEEREEIELYAKVSLKILEQSGYFEEGTPDLYDKSSAHYPMSVYYDELLTNLNSNMRLNNVLEQKGEFYAYLVNQLMDGDLQTEREEIPVDNKKEMLQAIHNIIPSNTPSADIEFKTYDEMQKNFYPLQEYRYIFDQSKFLITGAKGTGKTSLFNILKCPEYVKNLAEYLDASETEIENTTWIVGADEDREFPSIYNFDAVGEMNDIKCNYDAFSGITGKDIFAC